MILGFSVAHLLKMNILLASVVLFVMALAIMTWFRWAIVILLVRFHHWVLPALVFILLQEALWWLSRGLKHLIATWWLFHWFLKHILTVIWILTVNFKAIDRIDIIFHGLFRWIQNTNVKYSNYLKGKNLDLRFLLMLTW